MRLVKILLCAVINCFLLISCEKEKNEQDPQPQVITEGKLDENAVMEYLPYSDGHKVSFSSTLGTSVKYTVSKTELTSANSKKGVSVTMKGKDFDGFDGYNIDMQVTCVDKKQIEVSFLYTLKLNNKEYTQSGAYLYVDKTNSGEIPQTISLLNQDNVEVAIIEYKKGLINYKDENLVLFH